MLALSPQHAQRSTHLVKLDSSPAEMPSELTLPIPRGLVSLSSHQLTNCITKATHTYLSPDALQAHIHQPAFKQGTTPTPSLQETAAEYGRTCTLIWQTLWQSLWQPLWPTIEHPSLLSNDARLNVQIKQLALTWAHAKRDCADIGFFADSSTSFSGLQAKWNHPNIKFVLRQTTLQLQNDPFYQNTLISFPTCWAYLFGCVMYQLLQWNHQLTPRILRELWPVDIHPGSPIST